MKRILITAEWDEAGIVLDPLQESNLDVLNLPLEDYCFNADPEQDNAFCREIKSFKFVIYGGLRNARYFLKWMEENKMNDEMRRKIHLVMNKHVADFLEEAGIPAILPREDSSPIDLMEFLLRISINGQVLYPCTESITEEMPGLLHELEMPVTELPVCKPVPMDSKKLEEYRRSIMQAPPDSVLFHSRGSVIRTKTAFPTLELNEKTLVSASAGVTQKMYEENLTADYQASGSWNSVFKILRDGC